MTSSQIKKQIAAAKTFVSRGLCVNASALLDQVWANINRYGQALQAAGKSQSSAEALARQAEAVHGRMVQRCPDVVFPSGQTAPLNPDLLPPSFQGIDDLYSTYSKLMPA